MHPREGHRSTLEVRGSPGAASSYYCGNKLRAHGSRLNGGASPAPSASFLDPPRPSIIPPFPAVRGQTGAGRPRSVRGEASSGSVWCWPTAKFIHWKPRRRLASHTLYSNSRLTDAGPQSLHGETWPPRLQHPSSCEMGRSRSLTARVGQTCWPRVTVLPGSEAERMTASQRRTRCTQGAQVSRD